MSIDTLLKAVNLASVAVILLCVIAQMGIRDEHHSKTMYFIYAWAASWAIAHGGMMLSPYATAPWYLEAIFNANLAGLSAYRTIKDWQADCRERRISRMTGGAPPSMSRSRSSADGG